MTFIASEIIEPTSERFAGRISVFARLGELAEVRDVLLRDAQLHRFVAAVRLDRLGDLADAFGGGGRPREDRGGLALGLVDAAAGGWPRTP